MKYADLVKCVQDHNLEWFEKILPEKGFHDEHSSVKVLCDDQSQVPIPCDISPTQHLCGYTNTSDAVRQLVDKWLLLKDQNQQVCRVPVGAVVDQETNNLMDDLPVVLVVGINYGQGDSYAKKVVPVVDDTRLRDQLNKAFLALKQSGCILDKMPRFHLAADNFFPWITQWTWSGLNSIEEAILMRSAGRRDPVGYIVSLINRLQPHVVAFHGANNAVPGLGWRVIDRICESNSSACKFAFSDNLAPPNRSISNAVMTSCPSGGCNMAYDYDS